jgi:hypothetical protein
MGKLTMGDIGRELGISRQAVRKLRDHGMPVDNPEAARLWRLENLSIARRRPDAGPTPTALLAESRRLGLLALAALELGSFDAIEPQLRAALRAVPESHRARVELPLEVWDELTVKVRRAVTRSTDAGDTAGGTLAEAFDGGDFLFQAAAGLWLAV